MLHFANHYFRRPRDEHCPRRTSCSSSSPSRSLAWAVSSPDCRSSPDARRPDRPPVRPPERARRRLSFRRSCFICITFLPPPETAFQKGFTDRSLGRHPGFLQLLNDMVQYMDVGAMQCNVCILIGCLRSRWGQSSVQALTARHRSSDFNLNHKINLQSAFT